MGRSVASTWLIPLGFGAAGPPRGCRGGTGPSGGAGVGGGHNSPENSEDETSHSTNEQNAKRRRTTPPDTSATAAASAAAAAMQAQAQQMMMQQTMGMAFGQAAFQQPFYNMQAMQGGGAGAARDKHVLLKPVGPQIYI